MNIDDLDYEDLRILVGMYSNYVMEFAYENCEHNSPVSVFEYLDTQWEDELKEMQGD